ncbi:TerC/Alx family metal homeostasis membrane protein [Mycobacterium botniense]|uniref:Tellurium resistance protein TerC n=1 Tax=Mycobacterium botniense TaxID=84962 RepID=A0A7I9XWN7_9MYCO|nr:TerC/Alx family metal homeostasis membrane protein [Mycobacterium botniense]GFG74177.1 tellurium resistance protein TerC [Mycobacterium botniense]
MYVPAVEWVVTLGATIAVLLSDVLIIAHRPREPTMRGCAAALSGYVGLALVFGIWVACAHGHEFGLEFVAGWLTEYSLSVDNLFIFVIILARCDVPAAYRQHALLAGIVIALVFRGVFIVAGAAAIQRFSWIFYVFGGFLVGTAVKLARHPERKTEVTNRAASFADQHLNTTDRRDGPKFPRGGSKRLVTPVSLVILALAGTDLIFALDSIPAIYGLTREPYLVVAANVFALMGLRQLYFLLGGLLNRLVYLSRGLAVILLFIGLKLVLHALRENDVPFINGGEHVDVPGIPTLLALAVIAATLAVTVMASLRAARVVDAA